MGTKYVKIKIPLSLISIEFSIILISKILNNNVRISRIFENIPIVCGNANSTFRLEYSLLTPKLNSQKAHAARNPRTKSKYIKILDISKS
jgi:hypothetical protein